MGDKFTFVKFRGILQPEDAARIKRFLSKAMRRSPVRGDCELYVEEGLERAVHTTKCEDCKQPVKVLPLDDCGQKFSYECLKCGCSRQMQSRGIR